MSCNYYAVRKPDQIKKEELISLIQKSSPDSYKDIKNLTEELYGDYDTFGEYGNVIHLGHSSVGWRFLLNPNVSEPEYWRTDIDPEPKLLYPLTKQGLFEFLFKDEITIVNEYNEVIKKEEFWSILLNNSYPNEGLDSASYQKENPVKSHINMTQEQVRFKKLGFTFETDSQTDFYSDGLRWAVYSEFS